MTEASRPKLPRATAALGRPGGGPEDTGAGAAIDPTHVSRYIAEICSEMTTMANAAQLNMLAYLLGMARQEADRIARTARIGN